MESVVEDINDFNSSKKIGFTYDELYAKLIAKDPRLEVSEMLKARMRPSNNVRVVLFNDNLKYSGKRAVYSKVRALIQ